MIPAQGSDVPDVDLNLDLEGVLAALGIRADGAEAQVPYTMIRGHDGPRWLIPERSALARTILGEWRPYRVPARLFWLGAQAAYRAGAMRLLPGAARIELPANVCAQLMRRIGRNLDAGMPVVLVGNLTITRKVLVFLEDRETRRCVLLKVPLTARAEASIRNEARTLNKLNGRLRAPRILYNDEDTGIAMQEYLPGVLGSRQCRPAYARLLLELSDAGKPIALRERGQQLRERLSSCAEHPQHAGRIKNVDLIGSALALLDRDAELQPVLVHGDFAPWNIRELPDGACTLIDWESAREHGLPLHDLCHFYFMQMRLFTPEKLFFAEMLREGAWREYCRSLEIAASLLRPLAAAFLLETLAGQWENAETGVDRFSLRQIDMLLASADVQS
jgi:hypothetical protein